MSTSEVIDKALWGLRDDSETPVVEDQSVS